MLSVDEHGGVLTYSFEGFGLGRHQEPNPFHLVPNPPQREDREQRFVPKISDSLIGMVIARKQLTCWLAVAAECESAQSRHNRIHGRGGFEHTCECPRGILAEQGNGGGRLRVIAAEYIQQSRLLCDRPQVASFRKRKLELLCCTDGVRESRESALLLDVTQQQ